MKNSFCRHGSATSSTVHPCVIAWHTHTHTHVTTAHCVLVTVQRCSSYTVFLPAKRTRVCYWSRSVTVQSTTLHVLGCACAGYWLRFYVPL